MSKIAARFNSEGSAILPIEGMFIVSVLFRFGFEGMSLRECCKVRSGRIEDPSKVNSEGIYLCFSGAILLSSIAQW